MGQEKKIVILGLLALMIVVILSINSGMGSEGMMNYNRSDPSKNNLSSITSVMAGLEGFGTALLDAPIGTAEHGMREAQFLKPGEYLSGYISVINHYHEANDYLIFCLLDYRQVPFTFDNESGQILYRIHLESYEAGFYPFELAEIEDGGHDFEIVVMFRPYENNTRFNEKFRVDVWTGRLASMRLNLFVGNYSDLPAVKYTNMSAISCRCGPEYTDYTHAEGLLISKEPCSRQTWCTEDVEPGGLVNYTINAGTYKYPVTFAMMVLLDYEPIPINVNGTELVIFGKFEPGEYVAIPASLIVPEEKGVHELLVLWFPVPYKKLEILPGVEVRFKQWPWTETERVGLNVTSGMSESVLEDENTYFQFTGNVTQLWNESHEGANWTYACLAGDFDGDEKDDVLVFTRKYDNTTGTETATVIAKRGYDGMHLWEESVSGTESSISADSVGDLDGDGKEDVLVLMSEYNATTNTTIEKVVAKNGDDGMHLWEESISCEVRNDCEMDAFPAGDLDGDGKEDVFVEMSTSGFDEDISASTTTATVIAKRGYDGTHLWNESVNGTGTGWFRKFFYITASPAGDLDGDEKEDVLVKAANTTTKTVIAKRGYDGTHLWEESVNRTGGVIPFTSPTSTIGASPAGDLDGDGKEDVLVHADEYDEAANTTTVTVIAKRGDDGTYLWEESVNKTGGITSEYIELFASPAGDLDGDGKADMLVRAREYDEATNTTTITVIAKKGENGAHLWEDSVTGTESYISAKSAGDLDGDGKDDVLVRAREYDEATNTTTKTVIAKRGYDGTHLWNESVSCEDWMNCALGASPAGDLDGDGKEDVLVRAGEYDEATNTTTETVIAKRGYDGMHLWEEPVIVAEPCTYIPVDSVGDLDGDGKCDVLVHTSEYDEDTDTRTETVIAKRGYDGTHLWTAESDGPIWVVGTSWLVLEVDDPLIGLPWRRGPTDLTGDGIANILLGTHDRVYAV